MFLRIRPRQPDDTNKSCSYIYNVVFCKIVPFYINWKCVQRLFRSECFTNTKTTSRMRVHLGHETVKCLTCINMQNSTTDWWNKWTSYKCWWGSPTDRDVRCFYPHMQKLPPEFKGLVHSKNAVLNSYDFLSWNTKINSYQMTSEDLEYGTWSVRTSFMMQEYFSPFPGRNKGLEWYDYMTDFYFWVN